MTPCFSFLAGLNATQEGGHYSGGIGLDPVLLMRSSLYNPDLAARPEDWYNTSQGSADINIHGAPFGFFQEDLPGS